MGLGDGERADEWRKPLICLTCPHAHDEGMSFVCDVLKKRVLWLSVGDGRIEGCDVDEV